MATNQGFKNVIIKNPDRVVPEYVALTLTKLVPTMQAWASGGTFKEISKTKFCELQIPLPPLSVQQEIVAEIEGYQQVIDGARAVVGNYRPQIVVDPEWPLVRVGNIFQKSGETVIPANLCGPTTYVGLQNITQDSGQLTGDVVIDEPANIKSLKNVFCPDDILYGRLRPNLNKVWIADRKGICSTDIFVIRPLDCRVVPSLYAHVFRSGYFNDAVLRQINGAQLPRVGWQSFANLEIPLPPLRVQQAIVAEIEAEQALVAANRELIERFERKIGAAVARVWGKDARIPSEV